MEKKISVVGSKCFTCKEGKHWTKFMLSNGKTTLEQGHMEGPFVVTTSKYKNKVVYDVWQVAK